MTRFPILRPWLVATAEAERDARKVHYPRLIRAGELGREEAEDDYNAWAAIALWLSGRQPHANIGLAEMEHAAALSLQRRERDVEASPADRAAAERRDLIHAIYQALAWDRAFVMRREAAARDMAA